MKRRVDDHYGKPSAESQLAGLGLFEGAAALEMPEPVRRTPVRAHLRRVEGEPLPVGEVQRDTALANHHRAAAKQKALDYLQPLLIQLYDRRLHASKPGEEVYVTSDDVDALIHAWADYPTELRIITGQWKGCVFRDFPWKRVRTDDPIRSKRPSAKGTELVGWEPIR